VLRPDRPTQNRPSRWVFAIALPCGSHGRSAEERRGKPVPGIARMPQGGGPHHHTEQAKQLFSLVDELIKFSSEETACPLRAPSSASFTTRTAVEGYLQEKFNDDQSAKRSSATKSCSRSLACSIATSPSSPSCWLCFKEQIEPTRLQNKT